MKTSQVDQSANPESKQKEDFATCHIEVDTLYWCDFDEANLDGIAITLGPHAQNGTTF